VGFVVDKVALEQGFPRVLWFTHVSFIPPVLHYLQKRKKADLSFYLHHRVAQQALRLWCVRSVCCGALLKKIGQYAVQTLSAIVKNNDICHIKILNI
jgi:hypothetical protein